MSYYKYAYSLKTERIKEKDFPYPNKELISTETTLEFIKSLNDSDIEKMITIFLNSKNKLCGLYIMEGTVNQANVFPREIFKHAMLNGASAMILAHNHPSGDTKPSNFDIQVTKVIQEIAKLLDILVHDHIITSEEGFFSFREHGIL